MEVNFGRKVAQTVPHFLLSLSCCQGPGLICTAERKPHLLASVPSNTLGRTVIGGGNMISLGGGIFMSPLDGKKEERAEVQRARWDDTQWRASLH